MHFRMLWWLICEPELKIAYAAHVYNGLFQFLYGRWFTNFSKRPLRNVLVFGFLRLGLH